MSDPASLSAPPPATDKADDRTAPIAVYILYLLAFTGITPLIGLIVAYVTRGNATPVAESHLTFAIRTFWLAIAWMLIAGALFLIGFPLTVVGVGFLLWWAGGSILALGGLWFAVRCILGIVYLARGEAYPRPRSWLF